MPRTRSLAWSELKLGILALVALVLAAFFIFLVGGQGGLPWQRYHLKTRFPNVAGLKQGAVVRLAGVEVGQVASIEFAGAQVEVGFEVSKDMRDKITASSRAMLGSVSLLGESAIDIDAGAWGRRCPSGATSPRRRRRGSSPTWPRARPPGSRRSRSSCAMCAPARARWASWSPTRRSTVNSRRSSPRPTPSSRTSIAGAGRSAG